MSVEIGNNNVQKYKQQGSTANADGSQTNSSGNSASSTASSVFDKSTFLNSISNALSKTALNNTQKSNLSNKAGSIFDQYDTDPKDENWSQNEANSASSTLASFYAMINDAIKTGTTEAFGVDNTNGVDGISAVGSPASDVDGVDNNNEFVEKCKAELTELGFEIAAISTDENGATVISLTCDGADGGSITIESDGNPVFNLTEAGDEIMSEQAEAEYGNIDSAVAALNAYGIEPGETAAYNENTGGMTITGTDGNGNEYVIELGSDGNIVSCTNKTTGADLTDTIAETGDQISDIDSGITELENRLPDVAKQYGITNITDFKIGNNNITITGTDNNGTGKTITIEMSEDGSIKVEESDTDNKNGTDN